MFSGKGCHRGKPTIEYVRILRKDPCCYCLGPATKPQTVEHIMPSRGRNRGTIILDTGYSRNHWTNLSGACYTCNQARKSQRLLIFLLKRLKGRK